MGRYLILVPLLLILFPASPWAAVELSLYGQEPKLLEEVYNHEGIPYLALDDVLPPLGMSGSWDPVEHLYRIQTPQGSAVLFPGCHYLHLDSRAMPILHPPLFIDGRLRVAEDFVRDQLPAFVGLDIHYRNLAPLASSGSSREENLDHLFSFLLRKKELQGGFGLRGVAIDPGHGGADPGAVGLYGLKEKDVTLAVARLLAKEIKMRLGLPVFLTRDKDYSLNLRQRLQAADKPEADILIILHAQSSFRDTAEGATLFIRPHKGAAGLAPAAGEESRQLAEKLANALYGAGLKVNGIRMAPLLPLGEGDLPTVLVELGYLTHPEDNARLSDPDMQQKMAKALFEGIEGFSASRKEMQP
jgi:N-acetylmuramoyl-L-alanine amidase